MKNTMFTNIRSALLPDADAPLLQVVIDTEEEFNWFAKPDRKATGVTAMSKMDRVQAIFDQYGITPCYVVDYPVCSQQSGFEKLQEYVQSDRCLIGAHLHPWVNPPYEEELSFFNSYAGNLSPELEREKLTALVEQIENQFGARPIIYKAGRYGLGPNTETLLENLGFEIDLSVCPPVDYSADGGPDYSGYSAAPFWFGSQSQLLEIPTTGAFVGWAGGTSKALYGLASKLNAFKAKGILARTKAVDRLMLSPEGFTSEEHKRLTGFLLSRGTSTFTWSFHSTSVEPGMAPYVETKKDLEKFLDSFKCYFDYFFGELGGRPTTPLQLKNLLEKSS